MRLVPIVLGVVCLSLIVRGSVAGQDGLHLFVHTPTRPVLIDSAPLPDQGDVVVWRVAFLSPGGERITGILARPRAAATYPAILVQHGLPGNAESGMTAVGNDLAAHGAVVLSLDAPWVPRGFITFTEQDSVEQVQAVHNMQTAVDLLRLRNDVDTARVAYMGGSWGASVGTIFLAVERRLRAAVLVVPTAGLVARYLDSLGAPLGLLADLPVEQQRRWLDAMRPIEPLRYAAGSSPTPILVQNGSLDRQIPPEDIEPLHAAYGAPKDIRWYPTGHTMAVFPAARVDRLEFLVRELGLRPDL